MLRPFFIGLEDHFELVLSTISLVGWVFGLEVGMGVHMGVALLGND